MDLLVLKQLEFMPVLPLYCVDRQVDIFHHSFYSPLICGASVQEMPLVYALLWGMPLCRIPRFYLEVTEEETALQI